MNLNCPYKFLELPYVTDSKGYDWVFYNNWLFRLDNNFAVTHHCNSIADGFEWLKNNGYIKPDPLQKALDAIEDATPTVYIEKEVAYNTIRTLAEELKDG